MCSLRGIGKHRICLFHIKKQEKSLISTRKAAARQGGAAGGVKRYVRPGKPPVVQAHDDLQLKTVPLTANLSKSTHASTYLQVFWDRCAQIREEAITSPWSTGWRCHDRSTCRFVLATWCSMSMFHQWIWIKHKQSVGLKIKHLESTLFPLNFWKDAETFSIQNIIRQYRAIKSANETDKTESFHRYSTLPMDVLDKPPPQRLHQSGTAYIVVWCLWWKVRPWFIWFTSVVLHSLNEAKKWDTAWHSMMKYEFSSYVPAQAVETCKHAASFCDCDLIVRCFVPTCCVGVLINLWRMVKKPISLCPAMPWRPKLDVSMADLRESLAAPGCNEFSFRNIWKILEIFLLFLF